MQRTNHPWVTASVVLAAAGVIAVTPVSAPDAEYRAVVLTTLGQDIEQILAGVIDPGLAGAPAQAADTAATADLLTSSPPGFSTAITTINDGFGFSASVHAQGAVGYINSNPPDVADAQSEDNFVSNFATSAATDMSALQPQAADAAAALSSFAADPIQVFEADLQADWSQLLSDPFSSTTLTDLTTTLNAAPAAAQEFLAELIDPAAAGEVTAYDDANMAAVLAATAVQEYKDAATAAAAAAAASPSDTATIASETSAAASDVTAGSTDASDSATLATDAVNALASATPTTTLADLLAALNPANLSADLTALESMASADLTALESAASADLSALESLFSTDPGALVSTALADLDTLGSTASADLGDLGTAALADLGL